MQSNYKLTKEVKGAKFIYRVLDKDGKVVSTRTSARNYVAAAYDGRFYFGRLDLIGKGDHGRHIRNCSKEGLKPVEIAYLES